MKIRDKNPLLVGLIKHLDVLGRQENVPVWRALAKKLNRPRRISHEVNIFVLEKHAKAKDRIVVPGTVLGSGEIKKPVTVAALRFSRMAAEKIKKAGGKSMSIEDFIEENKQGKGVRIMG